MLEAVSLDELLKLVLLGLLGFLALVAVLLASSRPSDLRARLGELLAEKEALEKRLLSVEEELREARATCEREKQELKQQLQAEMERLREDYEKRLREAMDENKAALSLYEAVKSGMVRLESVGCREVLVQLDGTVLCRKSELELEVLWPVEEAGSSDVQG